MALRPGPLAAASVLHHRAAPAPRPQAPAGPAQGFNTARAQRWVMAAAIVVAMSYALRRLVEPTVQDAPARGSHVRRLTGAGSPPPALARWSVAYGAGFMMLALIATPAPEVAGALAILVVVGTLLTNGASLALDITGLQDGTASSSTSPNLPTTVLDNQGRPIPAADLIKQPHLTPLPPGDQGPSGRLGSYPH